MNDEASKSVVDHKQSRSCLRMKRQDENSSCPPNNKNLPRRRCDNLYSAVAGSRGVKRQRKKRKQVSEVLEIIRY